MCGYAKPYYRYCGHSGGPMLTDPCKKSACQSTRNTTKTIKMKQCCDHDCCEELRQHVLEAYGRAIAASKAAKRKPDRYTKRHGRPSQRLIEEFERLQRRLYDAGVALGTEDEKHAQCHQERLECLK